jgi:hypothetical protein
MSFKSTHHCSFSGIVELMDDSTWGHWTVVDGSGQVVAVLGTGEGKSLLYFLPCQLPGRHSAGPPIHDHPESSMGSAWEGKLFPYMEGVLDFDASIWTHPTICI